MKKPFLLVCIAIFLFSCVSDDSLPPTHNYTEKIIGEWQQVETFNLVDSSVSPAVYDWFEVESGVSLILNADGTFHYSKYEGSSSGEYTFNSETAEIEFKFDNAVEALGEITSIVKERFAEDKSQDNMLFLIHARDGELCTTECSSIFKRVQ